MPEVQITTMANAQTPFVPDPMAAVDLQSRVRGEFREMPGMRLTFEQATRLWALDRRTCAAVLEQLIAAGFLSRDDGGRYHRAHGGY
jgi:hypothetical protein